MVKKILMIKALNDVQIMIFKRGVSWHLEVSPWRKPRISHQNGGTLAAWRHGPHGFPTAACLAKKFYPPRWVSSTKVPTILACTLSLVTMWLINGEKATWKRKIVPLCKPTFGHSSRRWQACVTLLLLRWQQFVITLLGRKDDSYCLRSSRISLS